MTAERDKPYNQFNFQVLLQSGGKKVPLGGFEKVSGLVMKIRPASKRDGAAAKKRITKITGLNKSTDVTLKRGVINAPALDQWLSDIRSGSKKHRDVMIVSQSDEKAVPIRKWKLARARIIKHTSGPLNAKGNDVAIETLVISGEGLDLS